MAIPLDADLQAVALAALSSALFGAALVTTHSGLKHLDAATGARVSIPSATLMFWLVSPVLDLAGWHAAALGIFALVGLFYPAAVTLLTFEANRRLGPTVTGTVGSTTPLFAVLGAAVFLGEALGARQLFATSLIVLGTISLSRRRTAEREEHRRSALWLPWSAAALRALAQVLSKAGLALWPSPLAAAVVGYTVSSAAVWTGALGRRAGPSGFNRRGVAWFAVTGILNGTALLCLYHALNAGPVYLVSPIAATYPVFTLMLSAGVLREERMGGALFAGVALTMAGVVVLVAQW